MSEIETIQKFIHCQRLAEDIAGRLSVDNEYFRLNHIHQSYNNTIFEKLDEAVGFLQSIKDRRNGIPNNWGELT